MRAARERCCVVLCRAAIGAQVLENLDSINVELIAVVVEHLESVRAGRKVGGARPLC